MQRHLKWHKNLLLHKTDHSIKNKVGGKGIQGCCFSAQTDLLGRMKRDFYLANEVEKNNCKDIIKEQKFHFNYTNNIVP